MIKNKNTHTIKINPRRTVMKILFYDTKSYDKESFEATLKKFPGIQIDYIRSDLDPRTAALADGFDAVCAFVSSNVSEATLKILHEKGVRLVLLRCAGYNNVDLEKAAAYDICVMRVPGYSPEAVAEHAMALALACNRRLYKAYNKVRENDFSLAGLMGFNFYGKIAGIIGTGRIGAAMCRICNGFGMKGHEDPGPYPDLPGGRRRRSLRGSSNASPGKRLCLPSLPADGFHLPPDPA